MLEQLTEQLARGGPLAGPQVALAVGELVNEAVTAELKAAFLTALAKKGETTEEIAAFARELRDRSVPPPLDAETRSREILDVCGTGGDRLNTFNISTTVALVAAAAGVTIAKHGNRAITSQAGSADVLEALGVPVELSPEEAARSLREHGFAFFFAPKYHPAFRHIAPARKLCAERGQRTIFNFLGPLLNPARPTAQLVGVPRPELCEPVARVLQSLGVRRGLVACGDIATSYVFSWSDLPLMDVGQGIQFQNAEGQRHPMMLRDAMRHAELNGKVLVELPGEARVFRHGDPAKLVAAGTIEPPQHLDELSTLGPNTIAEFYQDRGFSTSVMSPENFPLQYATLADLAGGDKQVNAEIVRRILRGEERGPKRDAVLLNAAAALFVAGRVKSLVEGWEHAAELLDSGKAMAKLGSLVQR